MNQSFEPTLSRSASRAKRAAAFVSVPNAPPPMVVEKGGERFFRFLCWLGAVLALVVSFFQNWNIPWPGQGMALRSGSFVWEALVLTTLLFTGSLIGGGWWRVMQRGRRLGSAGIFLWSSLALGGVLSREWFWAGFYLWLLPAGVVWIKNARLEKTRAFFFQKHSWNGVFSLVWIGVCTGCDALLLRDAPPGFWAAADFLLGRVLNHLIIASTLWFLLLWHDRWASRLGRVIAWSGVVLLLYSVATNALLHLWWTKGWIELLGEMEVGGRESISSSLSASGVVLRGKDFLWIGGSLITMAGAFLGCRWLSVRTQWRVSLAQLGLLAVLAWMGYQANQLMGVAVKERAWRWWEAKSFHLRMTPIQPEQGLAGYQMQFVNPQPEVSPQNLVKKPDVIFIIVETLRADAIRPEVAPFLTKWREEECQPIAEGWAASNATHLSWFSILTGRLPVFYQEAREARQLAFLPALLSGSGYHVEATVAGDLGYLGMRRTLFGEPASLDALVYNDAAALRKNPFIPLHDQATLEKMRRSISSRPANGGFFLTSIDSTHFPYQWATNFVPPFKDYAKNPLPPFLASQEDVQRIVQRYWNSVSWVDQEIEEFMAFLKTENRYDDAIIVVTGDHGEEFREQGSWFHCSSLNPAQTSVPILIKWPKSMGRGPAVQQASHLDLTPTVLDALGVEKAVWDSLPGRSLLRPGEGTIVLGTNYAGKNGEALVFRHAGREAALSWQNYWEAQVPEEAWLERRQGMHQENLLEEFPDVRGRIFREIEQIH